MRSRGVLLASAAPFLIACGIARCSQAFTNFALSANRLGSAGPRHLDASRRSLDRIARQGAAEDFGFDTNALATFQGDWGTLIVTGLLFLSCIPGAWNLVQRTGQAKYKEKTYVMPGPALGGLEMRAIAGGCVAFFRSKNYALTESPQKGKIRFIGNLEASVSQALYLVLCVVGTLFAMGIVLQAFFPSGPFGIGVNFWFAPCALSPIAGFYYWDRAFRKDIVELSLSLTDDQDEVSLNVLADEETMATLQTGVRFQSNTGKLFALNEKGMEWQPGIIETGPKPVVYKEQNADAIREGAPAEAAKEPVPANA